MPIKLHPSTVQTIRVALPIDLALSKLKGKRKSNKDTRLPKVDPVTPPQLEATHAVSEAPSAVVLTAAPPLAGLLFPNGL